MKAAVYEEIKNLSMTAQDVPTKYVEADNGIRYAYRMIGAASDVPLVRQRTERT